MADAHSIFRRFLQSQSQPSSQFQKEATSKAAGAAITCVSCDSTETFVIDSSGFCVCQKCGAQQAGIRLIDRDEADCIAELTASKGQSQHQFSAGAYSSRSSGAVASLLARATHGATNKDHSQQDLLLAENTLAWAFSQAVESIPAENVFKAVEGDVSKEFMCDYEIQPLLDLNVDETLGLLKGPDSLIHDAALLRSIAMILQSSCRILQEQLNASDFLEIEARNVLASFMEFFESAKIPADTFFCKSYLRNIKVPFSHIVSRSHIFEEKFDRNLEDVLRDPSTHRVVKQILKFMGVDRVKYIRKLEVSSHRRYRGRSKALCDYLQSTSLSVFKGGETNFSNGILHENTYTDSIRTPRMNRQLVVASAPEFVNAHPLAGYNLQHLSGRYVDATLRSTNDCQQALDGLHETLLEKEDAHDKITGQHRLFERDGEDGMIDSPELAIDGSGEIQIIDENTVDCGSLVCRKSETTARRRGKSGRRSTMKPTDVLWEDGTVTKSILPLTGANHSPTGFPIVLVERLAAQRGIGTGTLALGVANTRYEKGYHKIHPPQFISELIDAIYEHDFLFFLMMARRIPSLEFSYTSVMPMLAAKEGIGSEENQLSNSDTDVSNEIVEDFDVPLVEISGVNDTKPSQLRCFNFCNNWGPRSSDGIPCIAKTKVVGSGSVLLNTSDLSDASGRKPVTCIQSVSPSVAFSDEFRPPTPETFRLEADGKIKFWEAFFGISPNSEAPDDATVVSHIQMLTIDDLKHLSGLNPLTLKCIYGLTPESVSHSGTVDKIASMDYPVRRKYMLQNARTGRRIAIRDTFACTLLTIDDCNPSKTLESLRHYVIGRQEYVPCFFRWEEINDKNVFRGRRNTHDPKSKDGCLVPSPLESWAKSIINSRLSCMYMPACIPNFDLNLVFGILQISLQRCNIAVTDADIARSLMTNKIPCISLLRLVPPVMWNQCKQADAIAGLENSGRHDGMSSSYQIPYLVNSQTISRTVRQLRDCGIQDVSVNCHVLLVRISHQLNIPVVVAMLASTILRLLITKQKHSIIRALHEKASFGLVEPPPVDAEDIDISCRMVTRMGDKIFSQCEDDAIFGLRTFMEELEIIKARMDVKFEERELTNSWNADDYRRRKRVEIQLETRLAAEDRQNKRRGARTFKNEYKTRKFRVDELSEHFILLPHERSRKCPLTFAAGASFLIALRILYAGFLKRPVVSDFLLNDAATDFKRSKMVSVPVASFREGLINSSLVNGAGKHLQGFRPVYTANQFERSTMPMPYGENLERPKGKSSRSSVSQPVHRFQRTNNTTSAGGFLSLSDRILRLELEEQDHVSSCIEAIRKTLPSNRQLFARFLSNEYRHGQECSSMITGDSMMLLDFQLSYEGYMSSSLKLRNKWIKEAEGLLICRPQHLTAAEAVRCGSVFGSSCGDTATMPFASLASEMEDSVEAMGLAVEKSLRRCEKIKLKSYRMQYRRWRNNYQGIIAIDHCSDNRSEDGNSASNCISLENGYDCPSIVLALAAPPPEELERYVQERLESFQLQNVSDGFAYESLRHDLQLFLQSVRDSSTVPVGCKSVSYDGTSDNLLHIIHQAFILRHGANSNGKFDERDGMDIYPELSKPNNEPGFVSTLHNSVMVRKRDKKMTPLDIGAHGASVMVKRLFGNSFQDIDHLTDEEEEVMTYRVKPAPPKRRGRRGPARRSELVDLQDGGYRAYFSRPVSELHAGASSFQEIDTQDMYAIMLPKRLPAFALPDMGRLPVLYVLTLVRLAELLGVGAHELHLVTHRCEKVLLFNRYIVVTEYQDEYESLLNKTPLP